MSDPAFHKGTIFGGLFLGLGIVVAAALLSHAYLQGRFHDRFVSVKGLAEREVDADLVVWPITFTATANDLGQLQQLIDANRKTVMSFLAGLGFPASEISQAAAKIRDNQAEAYGTKTETKFRYIAQTTVLLRSRNIALVKEAIEKSGVLVSNGVVLANDWESRKEFLFTGLNAVKPAMIEEATKNARDAGEKFAKDSGSKLGKIRSATQGLFTITDRDVNSPDKKNIRVVTTVEYYLIDD